MKITKGKIPAAVKAVIYGPEGIGKSTLASEFPDPVFIDTEGSTNYMDVARFDAPQSWTMLLQEVQYVKDNPDCCKTLVIDTADWAEKLCISHILASHKWDSIETPGYGKGYVYVKEEFGKLLNLLTVVSQKGVNVVLTAHAMMRKFEQPDELGAYDRWELKLSKQVAPIVKEWSDLLLFANYKTIVTNVKGKYKAQGGVRMIYTSHHPCWDAKHRGELPDEVPMEYASIKPLIETGDAPVPVVKNEPEPKGEKVEEPPAEPKEEKVEPPAPTESENVKTPIPDELPEFAPPDDPKKKLLFMSTPDRLPGELIQLMKTDEVDEFWLQHAVAKKGYYPEDVPIMDYDPDFIQGCLIAAWPQVSALAKQLEADEIPF